VTGNTEGTPQLGDSVETTRATPIDWSNIRPHVGAVGR